MNGVQRYTITITGKADPLFLPGLLKDVLGLVSEHGGVRLDLGNLEEE